VRKIRSGSNRNAPHPDDNSRQKKEGVGGGPEEKKTAGVCTRERHKKEVSQRIKKQKGDRSD